jgi:hypothetical protein
MVDTIEPEPDATPQDEGAGEFAERGQPQYLSEEEVTELEARIRESGSVFEPPPSK